MPPARLKVPWEQVEEYRAREARWERVNASGLSLDDPRESVAEGVIEELFDEEKVWLDHRSSGVVCITDPARLALELGLDEQQLTGHPDAFVEDGVLVAPWEVTELIATTAVRRNPEPFLLQVRNEERKARYEAIHGRWSRGGRRSNDHYFEPEFCAKFDNDYYRPRREILLSWCGVDAVERFDELVELRKEVRRVGELAQSAIDALKAAGHASEASRLQRELGTPVETLRFEETDD
ncbi:hypothetical protein SAMN04489712_13038 [Thermomonospora echinospora]|uniref:Uncharacterized protein n=1 Tax=Thermomonospora echinospora TaxID=1992 RepID=A0A1H6E4D3_9ACTN|nr:hypothetical protein SAMN04489712_13038 [Thermomonospora echinospora]